MENRIYQARVSTGAKSRVSTGANLNKQLKETKSVYDNKGIITIPLYLIYSHYVRNKFNKDGRNGRSFSFSLFQPEEKNYLQGVFYINHRGGAAFFLAASSRTNLKE